MRLLLLRLLSSLLVLVLVASVEQRLAAGDEPGGTDASSLVETGPTPSEVAAFLGSVHPSSGKRGLDEAELAQAAAKTLSEGQALLSAKGPFLKPEDASKSHGHAEGQRNTADTDLSKAAAPSALTESGATTLDGGEAERDDHASLDKKPEGNKDDAKQDEEGPKKTEEQAKGENHEGAKGQGETDAAGGEAELDKKQVDEADKEAKIDKNRDDAARHEKAKKKLDAEKTLSQLTKTCEDHDEIVEHIWMEGAMGERHRTSCKELAKWWQCGAKGDTVAHQVAELLLGRLAAKEQSWTIAIFCCQSCKGLGPDGGRGGGEVEGAPEGGEDEGNALSRKKGGKKDDKGDVARAERGNSRGITRKPSGGDDDEAGSDKEGGEGGDGEVTAEDAKEHHEKCKELPKNQCKAVMTKTHNTKKFKKACEEDEENCGDDFLKFADTGFCFLDGDDCKGCASIKKKKACKDVPWCRFDKDQDACLPSKCAKKGSCKEKEEQEDGDKGGATRLSSVPTSLQIMFSMLASLLFVLP